MARNFYGRLATVERIFRHCRYTPIIECDGLNEFESTLALRADETELRRLGSPSAHMRFRISNGARHRASFQLTDEFYAAVKEAVSRENSLT